MPFVKFYTVAYRTLSRHTERRVILPARRPVDHPVRLSHVESEPDGPAVEFTTLITRNWKESLLQLYLIRFCISHVDET